MQLILFIMLITEKIDMNLDFNLDFVLTSYFLLTSYFVTDATAATVNSINTYSMRDGNH